MIEIVKDYKAKIQQLHASVSTKDDPELYRICHDIKDAIINDGDQAVINLTAKFDKVTLDANKFFVTSDEIKNAYDLVPQSFIDSLKLAYQNIKIYHEKQLPKDWRTDHETYYYGMQYSALDAVCLYVPGGRTPYPSTVIMDSVPAQIAGVNDIIIATPPQPDGTIAPQILVAADLCGVDKILKVGGAQAVFATAYGTNSIPKVDKIVGPGNKFVTMAKQMVYGQVDIDKPAGPSEALVYVEDEKYAAFAAAELLAQLEHDPDAHAIGVSTKQEVLNRINSEIEKQLNDCSRKDIILESLKNSALFLAKDREEGITIVNESATEHLAVICDDAEEILAKVKHAGSIFLGPYTPVVLGDYFAGPNHVLPTAGAARFASPLGVMDFMKYSSFLSYSKEALSAAQPHVKNLTDMEGFDAHYLSLSRRLD